MLLKHYHFALPDSFLEASSWLNLASPQETFRMSYPSNGNINLTAVSVCITELVASPLTSAGSCWTGA